MNNILKELYNKIDSKKILVITGNKHEFDTFCLEIMREYDGNNRKDLEGIQYIYCSGPEAVHGTRLDDFILYGTWYTVFSENDFNHIVFPYLNEDWFKRNGKW